VSKIRTATKKTKNMYFDASNASSGNFQFKQAAKNNLRQNYTWVPDMRMPCSIAAAAEAMSARLEGDREPGSLRRVR
jgi:hypothetical protein